MRHWQLRLWGLALAGSMVLVVVSRWSSWSMILWLLVIAAGVGLFVLGGAPGEERGRGR